MKNEKSDSPDENISTEKMLSELKSAYKSISALRKTPSHRKIEIDIERKIKSKKISPNKIITPENKE